MVDSTPIGRCPICRGVMIEDEPSAPCDWRGRSTGDEAEDIFDGTPQNYVGHPGCVVKVSPDPQTAAAVRWYRSEH